MNQKTAKKFFHIFGCIFLICVIFVGIPAYIGNNPALLPTFPIYQNSTRLELNYPLQDSKNVELLGNSCNGDTFAGEDLQAYAINSDGETLLTYYKDFASNNGLEEHRGIPSFYGVGMKSSCFEGSFSRKRPTNVVNILDVKDQSDKISQFFNGIPSDSTYVILVLRGYILYV